MAFCKLPLAVVCLLGLTIILPFSAQDSPDGYLSAHNAARAAVGVVPMTWDDALASYAQNYANQRIGDCKLVHSGGPYGENIAWSSGSLSGTDAVNLWVYEKSNYDNNSNSCTGGECRHYTQVIWSYSVRLGCGKVWCKNGGTFIVCNYDPQGNYVGPRPWDFSNEYLSAHNAARAAVGVGPMTWDDTVASYAQFYTNQRIGDCNLVHSNGPYGENIAWSSGNMSGTDAVNLWVNEKSNYDYNTNSCTGGVCRHYTQVIWSKSVRLGCAKVQCNSTRGGTFIVCNYDPPGNYVGQLPWDFQRCRNGWTMFHLKNITILINPGHSIH